MWGEVGGCGVGWAGEVYVWGWVDVSVVEQDGWPWVVMEWMR